MNSDGSPLKHESTTTILTTPSQKSSDTSSVSSFHSSQHSAAANIPILAPPPRLSSNGMQSMYHHLRRHFTELNEGINENQRDISSKSGKIRKEIAMIESRVLNYNREMDSLNKVLSKMNHTRGSIFGMAGSIATLIERCNKLQNTMSELSAELAVPVLTEKNYTKNSRKFHSKNKMSMSFHRYYMNPFDPLHCKSRVVHEGI